MSYKPYFFQAALAAVLLTGCATGNKSVVPTNLRTEYLNNPIGLGTDEPRFTWEYSGNNKSFMPSKYEIRIGTTPVNSMPMTKLWPYVRIPVTIGT